MSKIELTLEEARDVLKSFICAMAYFHQEYDGICDEHLKQCDKSLNLLKEKVAPHEYNPKKWNDYPFVTPPEGIWMRVEYCVTRISNPNKRRKYGNRLKFVGGQWEKAPSEFLMLDEEHIVNVRFRPWED